MNKTSIAITILFFTFVMRSFSCEIPVFRYALERWAADEYQLIITKPTEGFNKTEEALLEKVYSLLPGKSGNLNLKITINESDVSASTLELLYPSQIKNKKSVWKGLFTDENLSLLVGSPVREKLRDLLLEGQSIVWVMVDPDPALAQKISGFSKKSIGQYKLSEEIIQMDEMSRIDSIKTKKELDNVIRSTIPLKISFSTLAVKRGDPKEEIFLNMLLSQWPELRYSENPVVVPVFGRGRFLEAAPADFVDEVSFKKLTSYLCSGCSCTVKSENPGIDLLLNVPWSQYVSESVLKIKAIPSLSTISSDLAQDKKENKKEVEKPQGISLLSYFLIILGIGLGLFFIVRLK